MLSSRLTPAGSVKAKIQSLPPMLRGSPYWQLYDGSLRHQDHPGNLESRYARMFELVESLTPYTSCDLMHASDEYHVELGEIPKIPKICSISEPRDTTNALATSCISNLMRGHYSSEVFTR
jgi:hypothetical protein